MTDPQVMVPEPAATPPAPPVLSLLGAPPTAAAVPLLPFAQLLLAAGPPPGPPPPLAGSATRTAAAEGAPAGSDSSEPTTKESILPLAAPAPDPKAPATEPKAKPLPKEAQQDETAPADAIPPVLAQQVAVCYLPTATPAPVATAVSQPKALATDAHLPVAAAPATAQTAAPVVADHGSDPTPQAQPHAAVRPAAAAATGEGKTIAPAPAAGSSSPVAPPPPASDSHADAQHQPHDAPQHQPAPVPAEAPTVQVQPHAHEPNVPAPTPVHEGAPTQVAPQVHTAASVQEPTPTRPAAPAPPPPPVRLSQLAEAAQTTVKVAARAGETSATITLHPSELGTVEVRLHYGDEGVTATMHADSPQAAQALQQAAPDLRRALENQGLNLLSLDVRDRREDAPRRETRPGRRPASVDSVDGIAPADEIAVDIARLPAPGTQIDVLA